MHKNVAKCSQKVTRDIFIILVDDIAAKKLTQKMMLGACFGFYRQESADVVATVEMAPLTDSGT